MRVLVACEFSQVVTKAFRERGHEAYSCDLLPTEGDPDWHIQDDIFYVLRDTWDMIIAFPYCTDTAVSGARWFAEKQRDGRQQKAVDFFMQFVEHPCRQKAIEHPISIMSTVYRKPDQIIQPWMFGHGETKAICLWLFGLPLLKPTNIVSGREHRVWKEPPSPDRWKNRSRSFEGIAKAMAEQWG